jgi:hypothetical protein
MEHRNTAFGGRQVSDEPELAGLDVNQPIGYVTVQGHQPALALARGSVWSAIPGSAGLCLRNEGGLLWVTVAGDARDHMLRPGERLCLPPGRKAVAQALRDSVLQVSGKGCRA